MEYNNDEIIDESEAEESEKSETDDDEYKLPKNVEENDNDEDEDEDADDDDDDAVSNASENENTEQTTKNNKKQKNMKKFEYDDDNEDDDDDDDDENYLQKLEESVKQNIILDYHSELKEYNYDEIDLMTKIVRNENGDIVDPLHKTNPMLTKYEIASIIGARTEQLNAGASPFVHVEPNVIDGYIIALEEFKQKKIPFIIRRPLPNGGIECWRFCDLEQIGC